MTLQEPDPAKLFGIRRKGRGTSLYRQVIQHDPCSYCGMPAPVGEYGGHDIDHIHDRYRGGPNDWTNLTAACPFCNRVLKVEKVLRTLLAVADLRRGIEPRW